ncbi:MAG: sulfite exporter TauE/SafE family protein [Candidatus Neomarinimicrobiota bacterium]
MDIVIVTLVSLIASGLTLFSGFGLGSILMPVMLLFFPVEVAVAATALVHLANNFFKFALFGRFRRNDVLIKFAVPAVVFAAVGAWLLTVMSQFKPAFSYNLLARNQDVEVIKIIVAALITFFALLEVVPRLRNLEFNPKLLPVGGMVSGLLGGLSGHQGAMRSAFLAKTGLTKEQFIGTGVTIACLVDLTRLAVYGVHITQIGLRNVPLIIAACCAAFLGVMAGKSLVEKVTMAHIQKLVAFGLIILSLALGSGII